MGFNSAFATRQALYTSSATERHKPGTRVGTSEGKTYRYIKAGAANLVAGTLVQGPAPLANNIALTPAAASAGDTQVTVTLGTTEPVTVNQFRGGLLVTHTSLGNGYAYSIGGHPAAAGGASCTLLLNEPLVAAINTSTRVDMVPSPYVGVVKCPTSLTSSPVGVAVSVIQSGEYGWIQTSGPAAILVEGTPAAGTPVQPSANVAGAVSAASVAGQAANTATTVPVVGRLLQTGVDAKAKAVLLVGFED